MRKLLLILGCMFVFSSPILADTLFCNSRYQQEGIFEIQRRYDGTTYKFRTTQGQIILFNFNNCQVLIP